MTRRFDVIDRRTRPAGVSAAAAAARRGRVVLLPTESMYALLTDAFSAAGVAAVRALKGRSEQAALPVAVSSLSMLRGVGERLTPAGQHLVQAFWPGPLTIVCRQQPSLAWAAGGTGRALTVRMPLHPLALDVIAAVGPSVLIGADSPHDRDPSADAAGIDVVLDAGSVPDATPSTVVDVRTDPPVLLREGALSHDRLCSVVPEVGRPDT